MNVDLKKVILKLDDIQQQKLCDFLNRELTPDLIPMNIKQLKEECYRLYYNDISSLINEIEVYCYTLPEQLYGFIEYTFNLISFCSISSLDSIEILTLTIKYEQLMIKILYFILIKVLLKQIKNYRNIFRKFNSKGVIYNNKQNILNWVSKKYKALSSEYKTNKIKFKKRHNLKNYEFSLICDVKKSKKVVNNNPDKYGLNAFDFDLTIAEDINQLKNLLNDVRNTCTICEQHYSLVISNGYIKDKGSLILSIFTILSLIIGFILLLV